MTLTLTQGLQNADGTWPITGTEETNLDPGFQFQVSGTLDQYGEFALLLPLVADNDNCIEWLILGSGDVTSQGVAAPCLPPTPPVPQQNFLDGEMDRAEDGYYDLAHPPLFKSQTDNPASESVVAQGWITGPGNTYPSYGVWKRVLPPINSFVGYAGRFVYEQSGGPATDGCYSGFPGSIMGEVTTTVTGGGWFVDQNGDWEPDYLGFNDGFISYYQNHYGPFGTTCFITGPQDLYIDGRTGPVKYITDTQMPAEIAPHKLLTGVAPGGGQMVTECEGYPKKGKC